MRSFFKKDVLVFWRDRKEVLISLLAPIAIIIILHFAFVDLWFGDTDEDISIEVGLVIDDDEEIAHQQLAETLQSMNRSESEIKALMDQAAVLSPIELFTNFLNDQTIQTVIHSETMDEEKAKQHVKDGAIDAIVKIPEGFTFDVLKQLLLEEPSTSAVMILMEEQSIKTGALESIIHEYMDTLNFQFALGNIAEGINVEPTIPQGSVELIEEIETISITQYFAISMSVLFALFIAVTVASKTTTEKRERVFNRILLTDSHPFSYLAGKMASTFCLAWFQLMVVIVISQLLLGVFSGKTITFWIGAMCIIAFLALTIAGLTALFTSITLRMNNTDAANGIFMLITMVFAAIGGNFFPLEEFPSWLQQFSQWTPNGLALVGFFEWFQYMNVSSLFTLFAKLSGIFIVLLLIAISLFPKRGETS